MGPVGGRGFGGSVKFADGKTSSANVPHLNVWGFDISAAEFPQPKKRASLVWIGPNSAGTGFILHTMISPLDMCAARDWFGRMFGVSSHFLVVFHMSTTCPNVRYDNGMVSSTYGRISCILFHKCSQFYQYERFPIIWKLCILLFTYIDLRGFINKNVPYLLVFKPLGLIYEVGLMFGFKPPGAYKRNVLIWHVMCWTRLFVYKPPGA